MVARQPRWPPSPYPREHPGRHTADHQAPRPTLEPPLPADHTTAPSTPSPDKLYRWAAHDSAPFRLTLSLQDPGHSTTAWTNVLHQAHTAAELHAVTDAVLGDGPSALGALYEFLDAAAARYEHQQEPALAAGVRAAARRLADIGDELARLGEDHLRSTYGGAPPRASTPVQRVSVTGPRTARTAGGRSR
ncbi:hypothetical protein [Streptomyces sp. NPDC051561]|uniref:hypothetical protein n=1 Tax=Streptomyces sp. NPDC051561 TaxID=3365658 RepID=UPI0037955C41